MLVEGSASFLIMHETKPAASLGVLHCRCAHVTTSFRLRIIVPHAKESAIRCTVSSSRSRVLILPVKRTIYTSCALSRRIRPIYLVDFPLFLLLLMTRG